MRFRKEAARGEITVDYTFSNLRKNLIRNTVPDDDGSFECPGLAGGGIH